MTTIRDMPLDCPEATYVEPVYKEAGTRNFTINRTEHTF